MCVATIRQSVAPRSRRIGGLAGAGGAGLLLALLAGVAAAGARGAPAVERESSVRQGPLEVGVRIAGRAAPLYRVWARPDRWYLEAREGDRYEVRVRNPTARRVAFLLAVDGLNAVDGRRTGLTADEPMYVLGPYESATIKGWRRSLGHVNRFVFVDEERSYAERTDQGNGDLGWIRVLAFYERQPEIRRRAEAPRATHPEGVAPQARGDAYGPPADDGHPGTGWGERERDRARVVEFEPEHYAAAHIVIRYEYRAGLTALGILPWRGGGDRLWERELGLYGFAQPPRR